MAGPTRSTIGAIEKEEQKRRDAIREELEQKLEIEEKAHKIVERLLDDQIEEQFLIDCARFILSDHYKDVVEERAIAKQCGYPICDKTLGPSPKKIYHISMKSNKVYDITDRKCFCSKECYKASKYYASQISSVPLWMRDKDDQNLIKLLGSVESENTTSLPTLVGSGEEVILTDRIVAGDVQNESGMDESKAEQAVVSDLTDDIMSIKFFRDEIEHIEQLGNENERVDDEEEEEDRGKVSDDETTVKIAADMRQVDSEMSTKIEKFKPLQAKHKGKKQIDQIDLKPRKHSEPKHILNILQPITESVKQWRTERTLQFLNNSCYEHHDTNKPSGLATNATETVNHENPVRKTENVKEKIIHTHTGDVSKATGIEGGSQTVGSLTAQKMKAMEEEAYRIRVESLFYGKEPQQQGGKKNKDIEENIPDDEPIAMPYVDSQSQMAIRRKIMLDRLNKAFSEFLGPLHLSIREFSSELNGLVQTFHLGNKNMSFKPIGWTLLAVILLYMLSRKNEVVSSAIASQNGVKVLSAMLKKVNVECRELENFVESFSTS